MDNATHKWMTRKAVEYLKYRRADLLAGIHIDSFVEDLEHGAAYADYTFEDGGCLCTWKWDYLISSGSQTHDCDTIHHYGKIEVIESFNNKDVAHPGEFAAPQYAEALVAVASTFWPTSGARPYLSQLQRKHGGRLLLGDEVDLGYTFLGAVPFREPPIWPRWAAPGNLDECPPKSVRVALTYLGWAMHLIEDLSVPWHARNDARSIHPEWEDGTSHDVGQGKYNHLPVDPTVQGSHYTYSAAHVELDDFPQFHPYNPDIVMGHDPYWTDTAPITRAQRLVAKGHATEDPELLLDIGIKESAGLLASFLRNLPSEPIPAEGAEYYLLQHKYTGRFVVGRLDEPSEWDVFEQAPLYDLPGNALARVYEPLPLGGQADYFKFKPVLSGDGLMTLYNKGSEQYMCAGDINNGGPVHYFGPEIPAGHEDRYHFKLEPTGDGYYYLLHKYSQKYVCTGDQANGAGLHLWGPIPEGHEDRYKFRFMMVR